MKKILYIGDISPSLHGASAVGKVFVESMRQSGFKVYLINTSFNKKIDTIERNTVNKLFKLIIFIVRLIFLLLFRDIDTLILMHSYRWEAFLKDSFFIKISKFFKKEILLYAQGEKFDELFYDKLSNKKKLYIDSVFKKVDKIVTVSNSLKKEYVRWFKEKDIINIYNICEPILNENEQIYRNNKDTCDILFLSLIIREKGIFLLLDAFKKLLSEYKNIRLIICGGLLKDREEDNNLFFNYINSPELKEKIDYRGKIDNDYKKQSYVNSDIFILPSERESFAIVNIEAMSAGLPVISTFRGAIPEYIEDSVNGYLIDPKNQNEIIKALTTLINNKEQREIIGIRNRRKFFKMFSKEKFVREWKELLT